MSEFINNVSKERQQKIKDALNRVHDGEPYEDVKQEFADVLRSASDSRVVEHVLKVFLVDAEGGVRNVYSAGFLDAEILRNDAATVLGLAPTAWSGEHEAR